VPGMEVSEKKALSLSIQPATACFLLHCFRDIVLFKTHHQIILKC